MKKRNNYANFKDILVIPLGDIFVVKKLTTHVGIITKISLKNLNLGESAKIFNSMLV